MIRVGSQVGGSASRLRMANTLAFPPCRVRSTARLGYSHYPSRQVVKRSFADLNGGTSNASFFQWYSKKLDSHPVTTKCISAGLISSVGNVLAQIITFYQEIRDDSEGHTAHKKGWGDFHVDGGQVGRFAFLNVIFVAPVLHHWYNFINRALPGKSLSRVVQRTFWDEFVFSPMYIPVFLAGLWKLEGTEWPKIKSMVIKEVPGIIVAEWALWVPTMLVTFRYAPVKFQVLVINVVGVVWQTFLSFMAANAHASSAEETKEDVKAALVLETIVGPGSAHQGCDTDDAHHHHTPQTNKVKATSPNDQQNES